VLDEEFGRVGVPPQALASAQADPLDPRDAMSDRPGSKAPRAFLTSATSHLARGGINRHEEFHIAQMALEGKVIEQTELMGTYARADPKCA
jgi:hypothetical protein